MMNTTEKETAGTITKTRLDVRHLTPLEFARLGVSEIAYVKPVMVEGNPAFAIHGADGAPLAVTANREVALAAIIEHEMVPISLH